MAGFDDVLLPGARGLRHLVASAVAWIQEAAAEEDRGIKNDLRFLVGQQPGVAAMGRQEAIDHVELPSTMAISASVRP